MHENREISCTPWSKDQDRSAKAINRTADANVQEKSDCAVIPLNRPNKEGQPSAEVGEGRAQTGENIVQPHMPPTLSLCDLGSRREVRRFRNDIPAGDRIDTETNQRASALAEWNCRALDRKLPP
jgi:hypothetical protein